MNLGEVVRVWVVEPVEDPIELPQQEEDGAPSPEPAPALAGA